MTRESGAEWGFTEQGWNGKAFGRQGEEWVVRGLGVGAECRVGGELERVEWGNRGAGEERMGVRGRVGS